MALNEIPPRHAFIAAAQPCFSSLQECAARLAGLLITAELKLSRHALDMPSLNEAEKCVENVRVHLSRLVPNEGSLHFHYHVSKAFECLNHSLSCVRDQRCGLTSAEDPLPALKRGWHELTYASRVLPGFETVDFRQSCCSIHQKSLYPASHGE